MTGPRVAEESPWHPTPRLRWFRPERGDDNDRRLQQLWQRDEALGPDWIEWRDVPVEMAD